MTDVIPEGQYLLSPGVRLVGKDGGGVVLQMSPLRAMRVNGAAFQLLEKCRAGLSPRDCVSDTSSRRPEAAWSFLESLRATQLLQWKPASTDRPPFVSIVVPVYNRQDEIGECLESLLRLNYPPGRLEIIVVDDASEDDTARIAQGYAVRLVMLERNLGQSAARNGGVAVAEGDIIAFIDSDCIADPNWLSELTPYFQDPKVALVGGFVASYYRETWLDRYEDAKSPLNMGSHAVTCSSADSDFYVPTCNMLVRKQAYLQVGGLDESWRVGEDVDLCWKLKKTGRRLMYVPEGKVSHKHRNRFLQTYTRRFDYGTSEPALYDRHREVVKRFPWQPYRFFFCLFCFLGLFSGSWGATLPVISVVVAEAVHKRAELKKKANVPLPFGEILRVTARNYTSLAYHMGAHLARYYLLLMIPLTILFPSTGMLCIGITLFAATVDFFRRKPRLRFPVFVFFYLMEQAFYQTGVFVSCVKLRSFRCYRLRLSGTRSIGELLAGWVSMILGDPSKKSWNRKKPLRHNL